MIRKTKKVKKNKILNLATITLILLIGLICGTILVQKNQENRSNARTMNNLSTNTLKCTSYWWFDNTHKTCQQKKFCGAYMYEGLKTFKTKKECLKSLSVTPTPAINCRIFWLFNSDNKGCQQQSFCNGDTTYQNLKTFNDYDECTKALSPTPTPVIKSRVFIMYPKK